MPDNQNRHEQALEYSLASAMSRLPLPAFRQLWQTSNELEQRVIAAAIREYLSLERWVFYRRALDAGCGPLDQDCAIDEVLATCGGEPRAAIKALFVANQFLETELDLQRAVTSRGYARGKLSKKKRS
jgi:hypothetical protein